MLRDTAKSCATFRCVLWFVIQADSENEDLGFVLEH